MEMALPNWREAKEGRDPIAEKRMARVNAEMPGLPSVQGDGPESNCAFGGRRGAVRSTLPRWNAKPETATRVGYRMQMVFEYAIASGWRTDNPAVAVSKVLRWSRGKKERHPAMPYGKLPAFLLELRASTADTFTKLGLEFLILTASRNGEVRLMEWSEVDTKAATWTVPAIPHEGPPGAPRAPCHDGRWQILEEARRQGAGKRARLPVAKG